MSRIFISLVRRLTLYIMSRIIYYRMDSTTQYDFYKNIGSNMNREVCKILLVKGRRVRRVNYVHKKRYRKEIIGALKYFMESLPFYRMLTCDSWLQIILIGSGGNLSAIVFKTCDPTHPMDWFISNGFYEIPLYDYGNVYNFDLYVKNHIEFGIIGMMIFTFSHDTNSTNRLCTLPHYEYIIRLSDISYRLYRYSEITV